MRPRSYATGQKPSKAAPGMIAQKPPLRLFFNKASNRIPRMLALVQPRESQRPVVLHSLADEHADVSADGCGRVPHAQCVIKQKLVCSDEEQQRR